MIELLSVSLVDLSRRSHQNSVFKLVQACEYLAAFTLLLFPFFFTKLTKEVMQVRGIMNHRLSKELAF